MVPPAAVPADRAPARTVLVVDDHQLVRAALVQALRQRGFTALACPDTSLQGIAAEATAHRGGVVLLDLDLGAGPDGAPVNGVDAIATLRAAHWRVVVVTGSTGRLLPRIAAAVAAGAFGQVPKTAPLDTLVAVVDSALAGDPVMSEQERRYWLDLNRSEGRAARSRAVLLDRLTPRERRVLELLAEGRRAVEIAEESVVSVTTVRSQIHAILVKLEVRSQLGAVAMLRASSGT